MNKTIVDKFQQWWSIAKQDSPLRQKSAVCVTTIDSNGYPHARFVDLKSVSEDGIVFCTAYDSTKGKHLDVNPKIALTAWWDHVNFQIRVVGSASKISEHLACQYWEQRSQDAKLVSKTFEQSQAWEANTSIESHFADAKEAITDNLTKPNAWGGYIISPIEIEFLHFNTNRLHRRECFKLEQQKWKHCLLQP